jgi:K+-transporting ATPase ATPase C chain
MMRQLRTAVLMIVLMTVLTGLAYPLAMTALAQVIFPWQANGSLIERDGRAIGSQLIGQSFVDPDTDLTRPGYFRGRPSAAGATADGTIISSGSNLGPTNQALIDRVTTDVDAIRRENNLPANALIPVDLVTASASGVDPHISPAAAELQVARVARQRSMTEDAVRALVAANTEGRTLGFMGEPRVHVLNLNLALDEAAPMGTTTS